MDFCNREIGLRTSKMSFFTLQKHRFCILKAKLLCNSLIMSRYKIENKKRVTIWLLLKFPELP